MSLGAVGDFVFFFLLLLVQAFSRSYSVPILQTIGITYFRAAILIVLIALILLKRNNNNITRINGVATVAISVLLLLMGVSLVWSPDRVSGIKQISYVLTTLVLTHLLSIILYNEGKYRVFCFSVVTVGTIVSILSYYEMTYGIHLFPSSAFEGASYDPSKAYMTEGVAWLSFGNPNDLSVHLCICIFLFVFLSNKGFLSFFLMLVYLIVNVYIILGNDARLVLISVLVFCLSYAFFLCTTSVRLFSLLLLVFVPLAILGLLFVSSYIVNTYSIQDDSIYVRLKLLAASVQMAADGLFLVGVGAGGFARYIIDNGLLNQTLGIVDSHNAFARVLGENGIVAFLLFCFVIFGPATSLTQSMQGSRLGAFILAVLTCMPLLLSVHSDPISSSSMQLLIALIWVGGALSRSRQQK